MFSFLSIAICTGGRSEVSLGCSGPDSKTKVPVSAIAKSAPVIPISALARSVSWVNSSDFRGSVFQKETDWASNSRISSLFSQSSFLFFEKMTSPDTISKFAIKSFCNLL